MQICAADEIDLFYGRIGLPTTFVAFWRDKRITSLQRIHGAVRLYDAGFAFEKVAEFKSGYRVYEIL